MKSNTMNKQNHQSMFYWESYTFRSSASIARTFICEWETCRRVTNWCPNTRENSVQERRPRFASICSARRVKGLMSQPITVHNRRIKVHRRETSSAHLTCLRPSRRFSFFCNCTSIDRCNAVDSYAHGKEYEFSYIWYVA